MKCLVNIHSRGCCSSGKVGQDTFAHFRLSLEALAVGRCCWSFRWSSSLPVFLVVAVDVFCSRCCLLSLLVIIVVACHRRR